MGEIQNKEQIAEICGAIIGDGWIQSNEKSCFIAGDPTEDKEYYDKHLSQMVSKIICPVHPKEFPYWKVYGISFHKKESIKKCLGWGLPKGKKVETAKVPSWIKEGKKSIVESFLRGFFDADGGIFCQKDYTKYAKEFDSKYHSKIRLRMSNISKVLMEEITTLCKKLNLSCRTRTISRGFKNNRNNSDIYIFEINKIDHIKRWFEEIKPANPKHTTKYLIWKVYGFCPPYTTIKQRKDILKKRLNPYNLY